MSVLVGVLVLILVSDVLVPFIGIICVLLVLNFGVVVPDFVDLAESKF